MPQMRVATCICGISSQAARLNWSPEYCELSLKRKRPAFLRAFKSWCRHQESNSRALAGDDTAIKAVYVVHVYPNVYPLVDALICTQRTQRSMRKQEVCDVIVPRISICI